MLARSCLGAVALTWTLLVAGLVGPASGQQETATPPPAPVPVPSTDEAVQPYLGAWTLSSTFQGNPISASIELKDEDGFVGGTFKMVFLPQPQAIDAVEMTADGIRLTTQIRLGDNPITLILTGSLQDGKLVGKIADPAGFLTADFQGVKSDPALDPFMGSWRLAAQVQGSAVEFRLDLFKIGGRPTGILTSEMAPRPVAIRSVEKTDPGLKLAYDLDLGGRTTTVSLAIRRQGDGVAGTLSDEGGLFSADFTGVATVPELAGAQASELDVAGLEEYLGGWNIETSLQGNPINLAMMVVDAGGKLGAVVESPLSPDPVVLKKIGRTEAGLNFELDLNLGGPRFTLNIDAALEDGRLVGKLGDKSGFFSSEFTGTKGEVDGTLIARASAAAQGVDLATSDRDRRRRRRGPTAQARLTLGGGDVRIVYGPVKTSHADYAQLESLAQGEVVRFVSSRATKLFTDQDLDFGEVTVRAHNFAESYPGVYALWLKRTDAGWHLVINDQGDAWGTMHDPLHDLAEIPLDVAQLDEAAEELTIDLQPHEGGGLVRYAWGTMELSARFTVD